MTTMNIATDQLDPFCRYKMPSPQCVCVCEGRGSGIRTVVANGEEVSAALGVPICVLAKHCGIDLGARAKAVKRSLVISGKHNTADIRKSILRFVVSFVLCRRCRLPELSLRLGRTRLHHRCRACGDSGSVWDACNPKLIAYIMKKGMGKGAAAAAAPSKRLQRLQRPPPPLPQPPPPLPPPRQREEWCPSATIAQQEEWFGANAPPLPPQTLLGRVFHGKQMVVPAITQNLDKLREACATEEDTALFLDQLETYVCVTEARLLTRLPVILKTLYDRDILYDSCILTWYTERLLQTSPAAPHLESLVDWLLHTDSDS